LGLEGVASRSQAWAGRCPKDLLLVGAGHAHLEVLRRLARQPLPGVRVTLITRERYTTYSGMLPGVIAGLYQIEAGRIDAAQLAAQAGARLRIGEAAGLDAQTRVVRCLDGPPAPYDLLSINIGSTPGAANIPGAAEHAIPVKPIDGFLARFEAARRRIVDARGRARIGVVGGGAGGVELILSLHRRLIRDLISAGLDTSGLRFTLIAASDEILPAFPARMRKRFASILAQRGIRAITGRRVIEVGGNGAVVEGVGRIGLDEVLWTTRAAPAPWLAGTGLALDPEGFIEVSETLQSASHADVLAAGDIATMRGQARPKSGVYAVRTGPPLWANLARLLTGRRPVACRPQRDALALISTGERYAIGARNGVTIEGAWVWTLKDLIDRRFVARFNRRL
jgi:selenide, water dikinase